MKAVDLEVGSNAMGVFADLLETDAPQPKRHLNLDPGKVEQGLAELVLRVVELVRQLLERQALRRIEGGGLSQEQTERLGLTLMRLEQKMEELKRHFEIESLDLDLGPLGRWVE